MMLLGTKMTTTEYKVVIPSAGLGSRLGSLTQNLNKSLLSIDSKPIISHIVEKFPKNIEIVVAVGYKKEVLKDYLKVAHGDRKITIVEIDKFMGEGSGLGYTLLKCEPYLKCPFIFCTNDTLIEGTIPSPDTNWLGYGGLLKDELYRSVNVSGGIATEIYDKNQKHIDAMIYIGVCGIYDFNIFWEEMNDGINHGAISMGESYGLDKLLTKKIVYGKCFENWADTGDIKSLETIQNKNANLQKEDEALWIVNRKVIKYATDKQFIADRVERADYLAGFVPKVTYSSNNIYAYDKIVGNTLEQCCTERNFKHVLEFLFSKFWMPEEGSSSFYRDFYHSKVSKRINQFFVKHKIEDGHTSINGETIPSIKSLIDKIPWDTIENRKHRIHGDLHPSNIIMAENGDIYLIDWRQSFGLSKTSGDIYYDFAKLAHGCVVSHEIVGQNLFTFTRDNSIINFNIYQTYHMSQCEKILRQRVENYGYCWAKVELIRSLIWLSSCSLHHYPYSEFLFYLGKYALYKYIHESPTNMLYLSV